MSLMNKVKEHFDAISFYYHKNYQATKSGKCHEFRTRLKLVTELIGQQTGNLLDCACGSGEITAQALIKGRFQKATVLDLSPAMIEIAKNRIKKAIITTPTQFKQIDIFKYEVGSIFQFDVILCLGLVAHTGSLEKLLKHLKPMLRTNGKIILQASLSNHLGIMFTRFVSSKWFTRKHGYNLNYYNLKTIEECVKSSGLRISYYKRHRFGFPFGDKISKTGNFWLEVLLERFSAKHGSEAIIIITHQE